MKIPFGMWRVTLPAWDQKSPPPHPDQHPYEKVQRWVSTPTLILLLEDEDTGGAGYDITDLDLTEAHVQQYQARLLEPWYARCRDALLTARADGDEAVARAVKGVYTGYIGRMASDFTRKGAQPWHHQPMWGAAIRAAAQGRVVAGHPETPPRHRPGTGRHRLRRDRLPRHRPRPPGQRARRGQRAARGAEVRRVPRADRRTAPPGGQEVNPCWTSHWGACSSPRAADPSGTTAPGES